jgi:hypothetical protein
VKTSKTSLATVPRQVLGMGFVGRGSWESWMACWRVVVKEGQLPQRVSGASQRNTADASKITREVEAGAPKEKPRPLGKACRAIQVREAEGRGQTRCTHHGWSPASQGRGSTSQTIFWLSSSFFFRSSRTCLALQVAWSPDGRGHGPRLYGGRRSRLPAVFPCRPGPGKLVARSAHRRSASTPP